MTPKGKLLIIGGAEDKGGRTRPKIRDKSKEFKSYEILGKLLPPDTRKQLSIEVITTASEIPIETGIRYTKAFHRIGFKNVSHMHIQNREDAATKEFVDRVGKAHAILFSGGNQLRLATILSSTPVLEAVKAKYNEDPEFIVAGTSAGAMAMSRIMIYEGEIREALLKGDVKTSLGFGLLKNCIVDTHFIRRGRFARLSQAVAMNPSCIGIGLGEDTALTIMNGNDAECYGSGMVVIIDGSAIRHTNIAYVEEGCAIRIQNLIVHVLAKGNGFRLKEREFIATKEDLREEKHKLK
jgi:cyanophycinase